jgi:integral membrane protein
MRDLQLMRTLGMAEGVSFIVLLCIAMPLKYYYQMPAMVTYTGWAHGLLFVVYVMLAYYVKETRHQPFIKVVYAIVAALVPFGTFVYDRQLRKEMNQH